MIEPPAEETTFPPSTPASAELVERASALVQAHPECFWFWHPESEVRTLADARLVVETLRQNGDHEAWREAQELHRCLSRISRDAS